MAAELLCCERSCECRAYLDPRLLRDARVLDNLLKTEDLYTINSSYFQCVQKDTTPDMRKIVVEWMLEVCEMHQCTEEIFSLAVSYLDRFLSVVPVSKNQLQLVASVCLLLASKLKEPTPLSTRLISLYTQQAVRVEDIANWELLIASKLKWNLGSVTASDFLGHILHTIPLDSSMQVMVRRHAQTFIFLSAREYKFCAYTASTQAGAAIVASLRGLRWTARSEWNLDTLVEHLVGALGIEREFLVTCVEQMDAMIDETMNNANIEAQSDKEKPLTPTEIDEVKF